ncbi:MAG: hypothetical protein JWN18_58 [Parcubacteria group bacterium]|nr:hypothetical protein [Parcubacteria group bacterium]
MKNKISYIPVVVVEKIKKLFNCKTYHVEGALVLIVLVTVALATHKGLIEYFGVAAVFFTFMHATIAEYMREAEAARATGAPDTNLVACHTKIPYYFYAKECCWFAYFFLLGANSALVGVIVFLLYQPWRTLWRSYHPR